MTPAAVPTLSATPEDWSDPDLPGVRLPALAASRWPVSGNRDRVLLRHSARPRRPPAQTVSRARSDPARAAPAASRVLALLPPAPLRSCLRPRVVWTTCRSRCTAFPADLPGLR